MRKGEKMDDVLKKKISDTLKVKGIKPPSRAGYKPWILGRHHSENTKDKLRKIHKGKHYSVNTEIKNGFKMPDKTKTKISVANKGVPKPIGFSENLKIKRMERKNKLGYINSPETRLKIGLAFKGRKLSKEHKKNISDSLRGSKSYYWRGGITKLNLTIRRTYLYRLWRGDIFERDNYTCQWCGAHGVRLNAHHIKAFSLILKDNNIKTIEEALDCKEFWDLGNGLSLCEKCHKNTNNFKRKSVLLSK